MSAIATPSSSIATPSSSFVIGTPIGTPDQNTILDVFRYCQRQFIKHGVKLAFPTDTHPTKTYQWRWLEHFVVQMAEMNLELGTIYKVIESLVEHAANNGQLRKRGLALLSSSSVVSIACRSITEKQKTTTDIYKKVEKDVRFVNSAGNCDRLTTLLARDNGRTPNIVQWCLRRDIGSEFISLSRSCQIAINRLGEIDKSLMPNKLALEQARRPCIAKVDLKFRLKLLFGDDWGVVC